MRSIATLMVSGFLMLFTTISTNAPTHAQGLGNELEKVLELNRIKPLQNPLYEEADRVVGRKLVDSKNKVVGKVYDVILNRRGAITSLYADLDRLQLSQKVYLNYSAMDIRPAQNSYRMAYDDDQIRQIYPDILAQTMTAAGENDGDISVQNMIRKTLYNENGDIVGRISTVLFGFDGNRAEALYVEMRKRTMRGKTIAIPFEAVRFVSTGNTLRPIVSDAYEVAMLQYLK